MAASAITIKNVASRYIKHEKPEPMFAHYWKCHCGAPFYKAPKMKKVVVEMPPNQELPKSNKHRPCIVETAWAEWDQREYFGKVFVLYCREVVGDFGRTIDHWGLHLCQWEEPVFYYWADAMSRPCFWAYNCTWGKGACWKAVEERRDYYKDVDVPDLLDGYRLKTPTGICGLCPKPAVFQIEDEHYGEIAACEEHKGIPFYC